MSENTSTAAAAEDVSTYEFHFDPDALAEVTASLRELSTKLTTTQRNNPSDAVGAKLTDLAEALDTWSKKVGAWDTAPIGEADVSMKLAYEARDASIEVCRLAS